MALVLKINDFDRSNATQWKSINMTQNLTYQVDTLTFEIQSYPGRPFTPRVLDEVKLERDGQVIFGGNIVKIDEKITSVDRIRYTCTCKDYSHQFDRRLVVKTYTGKPLINILSDILNRFVNRGNRKEIATMEPNEIWTGDSVVDTVNFRTDEQSRKLTSTNAVIQTMNRKILINMNEDQLKGLSTPDDRVLVNDASDIQNVFDGGGTFTGWIKPESDGLLNTGAVVIKGFTGDDRWKINVLGESGGFVKLGFSQAFSGIDGDWETSTAVVEIGVWTHIAIVYDADAAANNPLLYLDGVSTPVTETAAPTGTRSSDVGADLFFGNSFDRDVTFDGQLDDLKIYGEALTADAILSDFRSAGAVIVDAAAWWKFDDGIGNAAKDSSPQGNQGFIDGATFVTGQSSFALEFDSATDVVSVNDNVSLQNIFDSGGTVSAWINPDTDGVNSAGRIIDKDQTGGDGWYLYVNSEAGGFMKLTLVQRFSGTDGQWTTTNLDIQAGVWSHVLVTYDNGAVGNDPTIYVNGVAVATTEDSTPVGTRSSDVGNALGIGNTTVKDNAFDGTIDDVQIYSRILTSANISTLSASAGTGISSAISYWKFNELNSTTTADSIGSNTGTLENATFTEGFNGNAMDFSSSDYIDIDAYIDVAANLGTCTMKLGDAGMVNFFSLDITSDISQNGWNWVHKLRSAFSLTGTLEWTDIEEIQLEVTSTVGTTVNVSFDNWQEVRRTAFTRANSASALQTVEYMQFNYENPTSCIRQLVNLFEWQWFIDENKDVNIFKRFDVVSPFNLSDTSGNYVYRSLKIKDKGDQLRNSIIVRGGDFISTEITDELSHQADGVNKIFKLGFRYSDFSVTLDGVDKPIGLENIDGFAGVESVSQKQGGDTINLGEVAGNTYQAQQIIQSRKGRMESVQLRIRKVGSPADNLNIQIFSDDGSNQPSGTALSTVTVITNATISSSFADITVAFTENATNSLLFDENDKFHMRITRVGAVDGANYYEIEGKDGNPIDARANVGDGTPTWTELDFDWDFVQFLSFDALYSFSEKILTFDTAPGGSAVVLWTGKPHIPVIVQSKDVVSIAEVGEFQFRIIDKSILNKPAARQRASQEILAWAEEVNEGQFVTYQDGLRAGQTINVQSDIRGISENFLIKRVRAKGRSSDSLQYQVTLVTTKTMGIIYWMQTQLLKEDKSVVIDTPEELDRIENVLESFSFTDSSITLTLFDGKVWSNDAGTTPDKLEWDGGPDHIWI